ncbi:MAG: RNA-binding protein [Vicinamibacteria bacterium]|nr:RNA-binding protein [Vicinamibacteria bacterium]
MGHRLFVGNLPFTATEAAVRAAFEKHGTIEDVHLATDRTTGRSRGFAFVTLNSDEGIASVISKMDGALLDGRPLRVNEAQDRPRPSFSGAPFDGGFGNMPGGGMRDRPRRKGSRRRNPRSRW